MPHQLVVPSTDQAGDYDHSYGVIIADAIKIEQTANPPGTSQAEIHYIHSDHLNTPQRITNTAQQTVWAADYQPFGQATLTTASITNPLRFPGQYYDEETNLHYNYFRDYDPTTGRYIQSDPIGLGGGLNTYAYVGGDPINGIDPFGLAKVCGRALSGFPGQVGPLHHSQILYDDGTDSGFFDDDTIRPDSGHNRSEYECDGEALDDDEMKQAEKQVQKNWDMDWRMPATGGWNNCQNYTDAVVDQYNQNKQWIKTKSMLLNSGG